MKESQTQLELASSSHTSKPPALVLWWSAGKAKAHCHTAGPGNEDAEEGDLAAAGETSGWLLPRTHEPSPSSATPVSSSTALSVLNGPSEHGKTMAAASRFLSSLVWNISCDTSYPEILWGRELSEFCGFSHCHSINSPYLLPQENSKIPSSPKCGKCAVILSL